MQISPYVHKLHASYAIANTHHREMVEALRARDEAAIRRALRADINSAYRSLTDEFRPRPRKGAAGNLTT